jgi:hypothetical protein
MGLLGAAAYRQRLLGNAVKRRRNLAAAERPHAPRLTRAARILAVALGGGVLLLPGAAAAASVSPHYVGIVIGNGYACVRWHAGITGDEVLNTAARTVTYRSDGIVLTINGRPNPPHADDTHFWSYWHDTGPSWQYSNVGASGYQPTAGTVEGWSFDDGDAHAPRPASNPHGLYTSICGARDQPKPTPTRSVTPSPTHTSAPRKTATPTATHTRSTAAPHSSVPASSGSPTRTAASHSASARTSSAPAHRRDHTRRATATPTAGTPSASPPPSLQPAAQSLRPLPKPAAASTDDGSPVPLLIGGAAVVVIGAGGIWTALRRRRAS